jgi:WD40 repeat protein
LATAILTIFAILLGATLVSLKQRQVALESNRNLQLALRRASVADLEAARQRIQVGAWREGTALLGRSLSFWPGNRLAADYLLSAIAFGRGDREKLPLLGVFHDTIGEVAFSPDGRYFVTAGSDHTARIRETATGAQVFQPLYHDTTFGKPAFSPDGRKLLMIGNDGVALLHDLVSGRLLVPPMRHGRPDLDSLNYISSSVFSPDGGRILTSSLDHTARVWDATPGKSWRSWLIRRGSRTPSLVPTGPAFSLLTSTEAQSFGMQLRSKPSESP